MHSASNMRIKLAVGAVVAAATVIALGAMGVYSFQHYNRTLAAVYQNNVLPAAALGQIDTTLKDTRFRMAGVLLEQISKAGSLNQLNDARRKQA